MTTWTPDIIRARFAEAADIARRLPRVGISTASGFWPAYEYTFEDKAGWGTKRLAEERELREQRRPPTSAALSRHDEVMDWTARLIHDERHRHIVWAWAMAQSGGPSFSERCRRRGWVKVTAYRRRDAAIQTINGQLCNANILLRLPDEVWMRQHPRPVQCISGALRDERDTPGASPTSQIFDGDRPGHTLTTPQAVADFEKHLADTNKRRRREQERRKKLGLDAA